MRKVWASFLLCASSAAAQPAPSASPPLFLDRFDYVVNRLDPTDSAQSKFLSAGWTRVKREPTSSGANGWIYTTTVIPGFAGAMPGGGRVLALEGKPGSERGQTDFYLELSGGVGTIPADVWFSFWLYVSSTDAERSVFDPQNKLLYPTRAGYPADEGSGILWLIEHGRDGFENLRPGGPGGGRHVGDPWDTYFSCRIYSGGFSGATEGQWNFGKLFQNLDDSPLPPSLWHLITIHVDTSGPQGTCEMWRQPFGGERVKIMEWRGDRTRWFTWPIAADLRDGHRSLRIPTTENAARGGSDNWKYLDDFAMATSETELPSYDRSVREQAR